MSTKAKITLVSLVLLVVAAQGAQAGDKWKFGIGTGLGGANLDGEIGLETVAGPGVFDLDLDNSDLEDLVESAFGFEGFAAKDRWSILYSFSFLKLEGDGSGNVEGIPLRVEIEQKITNVILAGGYELASPGRSRWGVLFGVDYNKHEWENAVFLGAVEAPNDPDFDWINGLVGLTHNFAISEKVSWASDVQGVFGGSETSGRVGTGIDWRVAKSWLLNFGVSYAAIDVEQDDPGDPDFYVFDVDAVEAGIGFTYLF
jgi:hypothetical protein